MNVKCARIFFLVVSVSFCLLPLQRLYAISVQDSGDHNAVDDGTAVKKVLDLRYAGENLLDPNAWRPWHKGIERHDNIFICDNILPIGDWRLPIENRKSKINAMAWSKAEDVGGGPPPRLASGDAGADQNNDYSLYLDLVYSDGTPLWGQVP